MARNTSVSLGVHFTEFIENQVESGRYATASDVIRAALRSLEDEEAHTTWVGARIAEGMADIEAGRVYEDSDELWDAINREVDERIKRDEKPVAHVVP